IIVLPRRASGRLGVARFFYILTWRPYSAIARRLKNTSRRESLLSLYGPSFLLLLVGVWAAILVLGFAMLHCAVGSVSGDIRDAANHRRAPAPQHGWRRRESADCLTARLGSLGGRVAGKPPIVSSTGVFPLSTRRPVVDRSAGAHP